MILCIIPHPSPHDTNTLLLLYMVSTAGSRHHNICDFVGTRYSVSLQSCIFIFRVNSRAPAARHQA
ncbi:hypothetical protein ISS30_00250 [bacterium]|nr:hypothetical protein [bacterium]